MSTQILFEKFNKLYKETYKNTFKYIVLHCDNLEEVNDLVQDTYIEVYKYLQKNKQSEVIDIDSYIIGIAKNILKRYYRFKYKREAVIPSDEEIDKETLIDIEENLELKLITKENVEYIWRYIQTKDKKIAKIFYLYYCLDMKISEISYEMQLKESSIKSYIYRTIKELKNKLEKEREENVRK